MPEHADAPLRFADYALGRPYHAALVVLSGRGPRPAPHGHADYIEFMGVLDGAGAQLTPDHGARPLVAGDVALARPGDRHALAGSAPTGIRFVNIAFPVAAWRGFADLAGLPDGGWDGPGPPPVWHLPDPLAERSARIFHTALERFHDRPAPTDAIRFWADLADVLADATGRTGGLPEAIGDHGRPAWLVRVHAAMRREENLRGGVPRMRELAAVSPAHLARSMRAHYGRTPTELIAELRLERAAGLLCTTDQAVTRIAHRCGFSGQPYFTRCFAARFGVPPSEYRARARRAFVPSGG